MLRDNFFEIAILIVLLSLREHKGTKLFELRLQVCSVLVLLELGEILASFHIFVKYEKITNQLQSRPQTFKITDITLGIQSEKEIGEINTLIKNFFYLTFVSIANLSKYKRILIVLQIDLLPKRYIISKMEKDSYALFVDNSGSVGGSQNYWDTVQQIVIQYGKDIAHYYLWNSNCKEETLKTLENSIKSRQGTGGTSPEYVAYEIVAKKYSRIILVTDGEVGNDSVKKCDQSFEKATGEFKISKSICYIISTGHGEVNMSVTCPFTRFCDNQVFTKRRDEPLKAVVQYTAEDYQILDSLEEITLENFEAKYDLIEGLIIALNMGKSGNIPLKNQLVTMKNRVVKELSKSMSKQGIDYSAEMRLHLEKGNFEGAIEIAQLMSKKYFSEDLTTDIEKKISHLINLCGDLTGQYSIGQIKSNKMAIASTAKESKLDQEVEIQDLSKNPIECPIIMDEDVPQILIDECEPFLLGVEKNIVDDIAACPLRILNYPELRAKFKASISTFTGVKFADKLLKNPFTQNRLLGAIPLGTHKSHVEVGNHTIAKLIAGGKIMGNLNLYYAVIWYLINEGEIEFLKPIQANATEHLLHRLRNSKTMASLCGLAQFVTTQVDTDVAIWYCISSGYLNQPTDRDTFRFHFYNLEPMIKMVEVLGYPLHAGTRPHLNRTRCLLNLLSKFKKLSTKQKKDFKYFFTGLYQNAVFLNEETLATLSPEFKQLEVVTSFVPIDGEASPEQIARIREQLPKYCSELSLEELYHISTLLDAQKSASDIFLDYNIKLPPLPKPAVNWCYGVSYTDNSKVQFNPKTLRPFYTVAGKRWDECAKETFNVSDVNKLFKGCKYLENYVLKFEKLPNYAELLLFYFNRYVEAGKETTLPFLSEVWTHELLEKFSKASEGKTIANVIEIINLSRPLDKRASMEEA